jgi:hypothetical protein
MDEWKKHGPPKAEDIAEIMETVSTQLPGLIRGLLDSLFSPEAAANMGKAVAEFRKSLIDGGIPEDQAMVMTREYLSTLTKWTNVVREARSGGWTHHKRE